MRAPPEAETDTTGRPSSAETSHARANFSPTTLPIEPPMNEKSITASRQGIDSIVAPPVISASPSPVDTSASASRSVYGFRSKNCSGSADRRSASASTKLPGSDSCSMRSGARTGKWWPHCGQTRRWAASSASR